MLRSSGSLLVSSCTQCRTIEGNCSTILRDRTGFIPKGCKAISRRSQRKLRTSGSLTKKTMTLKGSQPAAGRYAPPVTPTRTCGPFHLGWHGRTDRPQRSSRRHTIPKNQRPGSRPVCISPASIRHRGPQDIPHRFSLEQSIHLAGAIHRQRGELLISHRHAQQVFGR